MKKVLTAVLALALLAGSVFAGGGAQQQSGAPAASPGSVTLKVGIWDKNQEPGITAALAKFTEQTGIKAVVEVTPWDQYWTLLEAAATGGSLPDVFWMHSNQAQRYEAGGQLLDLTDRIKASKITDMSKFPPDITALYTFNGKNYAIPKDLDTIALWYNKTHFDEVGLKYPDDTWTWDTLKDAAKKLTDPSKNRWGIDFRPNDQQSGYDNEIYQGGGYVINAAMNKSGYDDPKTIAALEYVVSFRKEGLSPPLEVTAENGGDALLKAGSISMLQVGSWMLSDFKQNEFIVQNCDMAVLPAGPGGKRASIYNGLGWSAAFNTKYPDEAWKLLEFFSSKETQTFLSETGIAISCYEGTAEPFQNTFKNFNVKAYIDQIPYAVFRPYSKNTVVWEQMIDRVNADAWSGARPVKDVCLDIAKQMNDFLAQE
jgi:multiple sugar transport system substrate-binding protein